MNANAPRGVTRTGGDRMNARFKEPMSPIEFGMEMVIAMHKAQEDVVSLSRKMYVTPWIVRCWRGEAPTPQLPSVEQWHELDCLLPFDWWVRDALTVVSDDDAVKAR